MESRPLPSPDDGDDRRARRRHAEDIAERERRIARRERDIAAREAELTCGADDRRVGRLLLAPRPGPIRGRAPDVARRVAPMAAGLWLMAFPLVFAGERGPLRAAALIAGAALMFLSLARARLRPFEVLSHWGFGGVGTWLFAWGGLGFATAGAGWALAVTGALVWALAFPPRAPDPGNAVPHAELHP